MTNLYNKLYFCESVENPHAGETKPSEDITEIEGLDRCKRNSEEDESTGQT